MKQSYFLSNSFASLQKKCCIDFGRCNVIWISKECYHFSFKVNVILICCFLLWIQHQFKFKTHLNSTSQRVYTAQSAQKEESRRKLDRKESFKSTVITFVLATWTQQVFADYPCCICGKLFHYILIKTTIYIFQLWKKYLHL